MATGTKNMNDDLLTPDIKVKFADGKMSAILSIRGKVESQISVTQLEATLHEHGIRYGIDVKAVQKLMNEFFASADRISFVSGEVAKGIPVKQGIPGKLDFLIQHTENVKIDHSGKADFRNIERFHTVMPGDVLVKRTKAIQGQPGMTVTGDPVKPDPVSDPHLGTGINVAYNESTGEYTSTVEGIFYYNDGKISVNPVLEINQNVGLETGNISYRGDIAVKGSVEHGSHVSAGKNLNISGNLEASGIEVGRQLTVSGGIISDLTSPIKVGGDLNANFIEHSSIHIEHNLTVKRSIVQSQIICGGSIYMPQKGTTILGGVIHCYGSIEVHEIGNNAEVKTVIDMGTNYAVKSHIQELHGQLQEIFKEIEKLNVKVEQVKTILARRNLSLDPQKKAQIEALFDTYKKKTHQMKSLENEIGQLKGRLYNSDKIKLLVHNTIHAGTDLVYFGLNKRILQSTGPVLWQFEKGVADPEMLTYPGRH